VKPRHARLAVMVWCVAFFSLAQGMWAQETAAPRRNGHPQDWSEHHIVFSRDGLAKHPDLIYREPRVLQQALQRWQVPTFGAFEGSDLERAPSVKSGQHRDWSTSLGGHLLGNEFPAKFTFYPDQAPSCTQDYVVFGLTNTNGANLVAFNNLYSDPVNGGGLCDPPTAPYPGPLPLFAYHITTITGGHVITSPILSLDGTEIGFVESVPANSGMGITPHAIFHVVAANGGGTIASPVTPAMVSLTLSTAGSDIHSSPWIDYGRDVVYVGTDDGYMHKITGVFKGTPTLAPAPWPILVGTALKFSPPVLDQVRNLLMFGASNGSLYQIDTTTGEIATLPIGAGLSLGITAAPIVDVANGTTFVVTADVGYAAALVEVNTATMTQISLAQLGLGSSGGTSLTLYEPAFSNSYFNDPTTGIIRICGTGPSDTSPYQYAFGFTGTTMHSTNIAGFPAQLITTSTAARCTGWTEFFNPSVGVDGTDYFFFGLSQDCTAPGNGGVDGCVAEVTGNSTTPLQVTINGGPSGIVIDNYSTAPQASSLYFTAVRAMTGYKLTQNGLQ
jgi:hypothetical protein